jgi:hypothetical protein
LAVADLLLPNLTDAHRKYICCIAPAMDNMQGQFGDASKAMRVTANARSTHTAKN